MKRRDFLKYIGVGGAGGALGFIFGKVSKPPVGKLMPYLIPDPDIIPGLANWYAGLCTHCSAGCGTLVKVMEGRVKKIEGNPEHPVNKGKLCALGQALPQTLYNPDRIKKPLKRTGERGAGQFAEISWDEAVATVAKNIADLDKSGNANKVYLLTQPLRGTIAKLADAFMSSLGTSNIFEYELFQNRNLLYALQSSMGLNYIPRYDIENTKYLLSFGADFTSTWVSPVGYSDAYGKMRQAAAGGRGKLVQVEPRMSLTGASADEWVAARPGTEAVLALSIAYAIVEKGYYRGGEVDAWRSALGKYKPSSAAHIVDVSEERIYQIAHDFAKTRPSLAIGGETVSSYQDGVSGLTAVNILNHLAGNNGIKGGVIANAAGARVDFKKGIAPLINDAAKGRVKALIINNTNPVFTTPDGAKTVLALKNTPFIVSLASFIDETSAFADIVLPLDTCMEGWGDDEPNPSVGFPCRTLMQPAVTKVYDTKGAGDVFLAVAKAIGNKTAGRLKAASYADYLRDAWRDEYARNKGMSAGTLTFDEFWGAAVKKGGWWRPMEEGKKAIHVSARAATDAASKGPSRFEGDEKDFPLYFMIYPHHVHRDGRGANIPWLQEAPDPMTSVVWGNWIEINPKTASRLGLREGAMAIVESPFGKISAPVYFYEAIRPDTVAMPAGQGHTAYGRYAQDRGQSPIKLLPFKNELSGAFALNATRVKVTPANMPGNLVKMEASTKELGRGIVQTMTAEEFARVKHAPAISKLGKEVV